MRRLYIFLLALSIGFAACTSSDSNKASAEENSSDEAITNLDEASAEELGYETKVITADIPSPRKEMTAAIGEETLVVNYGSPSVKERTVWGELVPYNEVWRTGANEATTFTISSDMKVQGEALAAGKYALFTIPKEDGNWTVIFNSESDQWGAYKYDESKDVLRVDATAEAREEASETMEFVMNDGVLVWKWENLALPIQLEM